MLIKQLSKIKKNYSNLFIYGIGQIFNLGTPIITVPYIILKCGEENFGKIGVGLAIYYFLIVIVDYGSDIIGVKEVSINRNDNYQLEKIFTTAFSAKLILLIFVLIVSFLAFSLIPYFKQDKFFFILGFPILIGQFLNPIWFFQGVENFKWITIVNLIARISYILGIYIFINSATDYVYVNFLWGASMIIPFSVGIFYCIKKYKISFRNTQIENINKFIKDDFKLCFSQMFLSLKNYAPIILISFLGGYSIAGYYKVIEQIIMPFRTYLQMFFRFFYPKLCFEIFEDRNKGVNYWKKINFFNLIIVIVLLVFIFIFSKNVLRFFQIEEQTLVDFNSTLRFSLLIPLFITLSFILEQLLLILENKQKYIKITIITVLLNFILMFVLFNYFKLEGILFALLITEIVLITMYSLILKAYFKK